jgi:hypothetical protein
MVASAAGQSVPVPIRVVALSGQPIAGGPAGTVIVNSSLLTQQLSINLSGRVAFLAVVDDPINPTREATISDVDGLLQAVAIVDQSQSQFPFATTFSSFDRVVLTDGFLLSVYGQTADLATSRLSLATKAYAEPWNLLLRNGDPAPGTSPGVSFNFGADDDAFRRSAFGGGAFYTSLANGGTTSSNNRALYRVSATNSMSLFARTGDQPPSTIAPSNTAYRTFDSALAMNDANQLLFMARFGPAIGASTDVLLVDSNHQLREVARQGAATPGVDGRFAIFQAWRLNQAGRVAFSAVMDGVAPTPDADGIWVETPSGLRLVALGNTQPPGVAAGLLFLNAFDGGPGVWNDEGQLVFFANLTGGGVAGSNDTCLFMFDGSELRLVIREGVQQAPGLPAGIALSGVFAEGNSGASRLQFNNQGQFVFRSTITGAGVTSANNQVLWAGTSPETLRPIVRSGQTVDIDNRPEVTTLRTIASITEFANRAGTAGGEPRVLNENQELIFGVQFTDNSRAVLVANLACVRVDQQPIGTTVCPGASVPLVAIGVASNAVTYQWQRQVAGAGWTNLVNGVQPDGSTVAGVDQSQLTLGNVRGGTSQYRAVMSSTCGSTNSAPATVNVTRQCGLADVAGQGAAALPCGDETLDKNDFVVFIGWFFDGNISADIAGQGASEGADGSFDNNDFVLFIQRFFGGC